MLAHLLRILLDQFFDVREHQYARLRPLHHSILAQRGNNVTLACAGRQNQTGVTGWIELKPSV